MGDWLRHIALNAKAKSGFGPQFIVWFLIAAVSLTLALGFLCAAAFMWLANRYDAVTAGLILAGVFLAIALIAAVAAAMAQRRNRERARLELAARSRAGWLDPKLLAVGIEIGRTLGWRRIIALAAAGVLAAGAARELFGAGETSESRGRRPES
jgi:hypothetical protein